MEDPSPVDADVKRRRVCGAGGEAEAAARRAGHTTAPTPTARLALACGDLIPADPHPYFPPTQRRG